VEQSNRIAILQMAYELFDRRDVDSLLALMTPDIEWPNLLDDSLLQGRREVRSYWEALWSVAKPRLVPKDFVEEGDHVVVAAEIEVFDPEGRSLGPPSVGIHRFTFRGDLVARFEAFRSGPDIAARIRARLSRTYVRDWLEAHYEPGEPE